MIKLTRPPKPVELTEEVQEKLTKKFIETKDRVYAVDYIKDALMIMSHDKCAYCECDLTKESNYMEVEHYHDKHDYPEEVVKWENLLPSCKHCNGNKSTHDTYDEPIIDPSKDNPKEHLYFKSYAIRGKDDLGKITVEVIDLNDKLRLVRVRFDIGEEIRKKLDTLLTLTKGYVNRENNLAQRGLTRRKNKIVGTLRDLLQEAQPTSDYSATAATVLLNDEDYQQIKTYFQQANIWSEELIELEQKAQECALEMRGSLNTEV